MEKIIVSFLVNDEEKELLIPNEIESTELVQILIDTWNLDFSTVRPDLEVSTDQIHWFKVDKQMTLLQSNIWDGAFLRLCEEGNSLLPSIQKKEHEENEEEFSYEEQSNYVWKVIE